MFVFFFSQGEYLNGTRNGYGCYVYLSGAVYTGEFKNDIKHGHGLYKYASEDMYEGGLVFFPYFNLFSIFVFVLLALIHLGITSLVGK